MERPDDPHARPEENQPEGTRVGVGMSRGGRVRFVIEVAAGRLEELGPVLPEDPEWSRRESLRWTSLDPEQESSLLEALRRLAELQREARANGGPQFDESDAEDARADTSFEADLDYVLDKNAELYKRLAR
jgi:hypothetical protein